MSHPHPATRHFLTPLGVWGGALAPRVVRGVNKCGMRTPGCGIF